MSATKRFFSGMTEETLKEPKMALGEDAAKFDSFKAKKAIEALAAGNPSSEGRISALLDVVIPQFEPTAEDTSNLKALLAWPVLKEEFEYFAAEVFQGPFKSELPKGSSLVRDTVKQVIRTSHKAIAEGTFWQVQQEKSSVDDNYVQSIVRLLMRLNFPDSYAKQHGTSVANNLAVQWLADLCRENLEEAVWVIQHTLMLLHLEECKRVAKGRSTFDKVRLLWDKTVHTHTTIMTPHLGPVRVKK
jgi:hypothetical protein